MKRGVHRVIPGGMAPPRRGRRWAWLWTAGVLWLAAGCASDVALAGGRYRHTRHDFSVAAPGPSWQRFDVEGAWLAFRRPGPQTMTLQVHCGRPITEPAIMARHLVLGIRDRTVVQAGPVQVAGSDGWTQTFDTRADGVPVRVKTVTLVVAPCVYDWTLAAAVAFEDAERDFDAWWASVRIGATDAREAS